MSEIKKINLTELKKTYKRGLLIPEIQRDYVMGAGKNSNIKKMGEKDNLDRLLDAILLSFDEKKDFDFSCIITFCKDNDFSNNRLEIYDGQQRLTTLVLLTLFCLQREAGEKYKDYKGWYTFCGRPIADEILNLLTNDEFQIESIKVKDFTSFSMKSLLSRFAEKKYEEITSDFLLNKVKFDCVEVGNQNEIEQFFMDLNSGVKLKEYELYKAKLVHQINQILKQNGVGSDYERILKTWTHRLDNEWINAFMPFADFSHPAEEYEIAFIRYCFRMLCKYNNIQSKDGISELNFSILKECFDIMNSLSKVSFSKFSKSKLEVVEFSWGNDDEYSLIKKSHNFDKRGAYWNLDYDDNIEQMYYVIKNVLLNSELNSELDKDLIVWACITTLDWQIDYQNEYIRILKIILNHIVMENSEAWYECQDKGQYLYYSKFCVFNIPSYYGKHMEILIKNDDLYDEYECVYKVVKYFFKNKMCWKRILNKKNISKNIMEEMQKVYSDTKCIIGNRQEWMSRYHTYEEFCVIENKKNGVLQNSVEDGHYLARVNLAWPALGKNSNCDKCYVLLKCHMDKLFVEYKEENDNLVKNYEVLYQKNIFSEFEKEKCFWVSKVKAYKLMNRESRTAKTYVKYGGTDRYYWAWAFDGINKEEKKV